MIFNKEKNQNNHQTANGVFKQSITKLRLPNKFIHEGNSQFTIMTSKTYEVQN